MQVRADEVVIGDKVLALDPVKGSFLRTIECLAADLESPHDVTVTLRHVEGLRNDPITVTADAELTVVR